MYISLHRQEMMNVVIIVKNVIIRKYKVEICLHRLEKKAYIRGVFRTQSNI